MGKLRIQKMVYKRRSPVQEKLAKIKEIVLKDAESGEKSMIELADIYGVHQVSLLKFHRMNGIKKKRKNVKYRSNYNKGYYKKRIDELRGYIKENNISQEEIKESILSLYN